MKRVFLTFLLCLIIHEMPFAQGVFSGDVNINSIFYHRDSARGASGTPFYDNLFSGGEGWLNLNYRVSGFDLGARLDIFNNSAIHNPQQPFTGNGIGLFYVSKQLEKLKITGGHFYDQFGSGLTFRSYEERGLGIDNAIFGLHVRFDINDNWMVKGFTGQQKNLFTTFKPIIKGANIEGIIPLSDNLQINPGAAFVNRTLDQTSMNLIASEISSYPLVQDRFTPKFNVYVGSIYNSLIYKKFSWDLEVAMKSNEAIKDETGVALLDKPGLVLYSNLNYATKGFGATVQFRSVETFPFRTSPLETFLNGLVNYLPAFSKQNTYTLVARYAAVPQEFGEVAYQADFVYTPKRGYSFSLNVANVVSSLDGLNASDFLNPFNENSSKLFSEINFEANVKISNKLILVPGIQYVLYNQGVYEFKPGVPLVKALTPFLESTYKITRKNSLRSEIQFMITEQDFGGWVLVLLEYNIAPKFSFSALDMYNYNPKKTAKLHYPTLSITYTHQSSKLIASYGKQVEGIVCTGGICRWEPAFSGVKLTLLTSF